jgi:hypothetical protein
MGLVGYLAEPFVVFPDIYVNWRQRMAVTIVSSITEAEDAVNAKSMKKRIA